MAKKRLLSFYGTECVHCHDMDPLNEKLEKELKIKLTKLEVWHNSKNAKILKDLDKGYCGGVPFYFNENTGKWICGAVPYKELKAWAKGE